eukprot:g55277.t1
MTNWTSNNRHNYLNLCRTFCFEKAPKNSGGFWTPSKPLQDLGPSDHQKDWLPSLDNECNRFHVSSLRFKAHLDKPLQRVVKKKNSEAILLHFGLPRLFLKVFTTQACHLGSSRPMLQARSVEIPFRQASVEDSVRKKYHNFPTHAQLDALENGVLFRYCSKAKDWLQEGFSGRKRRAELKRYEDEQEVKESRAKDDKKEKKEKEKKERQKEKEEGAEKKGKKHKRDKGGSEKEEEDKKEAERKKKEEEDKKEAERKKKEEEAKEEAGKKKEEEEKEEARKKKEEEEKEEARTKKEEDKKEAERKKKEEEDEEKARKKKGEEEKKKEEPEGKKKEEEEEKKKEKPEGKKKEEEKEKEEQEGKELDLTSLDAADDPDQRGNGKPEEEPPVKPGYVRVRATKAFKFPDGHIKTGYIVASLLGGYVAQARNTIQIVEPSPDGEVAVISRPAVPFPKKTGSRKEGRPEHILLVRRVVQGGTLDKPLYQNFFLPYNKIDPTVSASLPRISTEEYKATITPDLAKTKPGAVPHDIVVFVPYFKPLPLVQALTESRPTRECTKGPKNYKDSVSLTVLTPDGGDEQAELTGTVPAEKSKKSKHKKPGKNKDKPQKTKPESPTSGQSTAPVVPPVVPGLPVLPDTTPQLQGEQLHSSEMVDRMFSMFDKMIKEKQKHNSEQNAKLMEVLRPTKPTGHDQDSQPASNELVIVTRTPTGTENQVHSVNGGSPNGGGADPLQPCAQFAKSRQSFPPTTARNPGRIDKQWKHSCRICSGFSSKTHTTFKVCMPTNVSVPTLQNVKLNHRRAAQTDPGFVFSGMF